MELITSNLPKLEIFEPFFEFFQIWLFLLSRTWWFLLLIGTIGLYVIWLNFARRKYLSSINYILLAIDVPEENEVNPKAVEQLFAGLHGIHSVPNFVERNLEGKQLEPLSLEIIGINGHVRFLIRAPEYFRDLIEAHVYAQYPEAEIKEVEDYTQFMPSKFPDEHYKMWGAELILNKEDAYPIRTYQAFTDEMNKGFLDPMASITETLSRLGVGEQVWLQFVIRPTFKDDWRKAGERIVKKLIGAKTEEFQPKFVNFILKPIHAIIDIINSVLVISQEGGETISKTDVPSQVQFLSPGERDVVEAIETNISKIGFETKIRLIYIAKKDVFSKQRGIQAPLGAIRQFNTLNLNGFKPYSKTITSKPSYFFTKERSSWRQNKLMKNYKERSLTAGAPVFIFNTEELATVYHFPYITVKTPSIKKAEVKKAGPPADLPLI